MPIGHPAGPGFNSLSGCRSGTATSLSNAELTYQNLLSYFTVA